MNIVDTVLEYCKPTEWEYATYSSKLYHLFHLEQQDEEYENEVIPFLKGSPRLTVNSLQRYQNPFLLGKLIIRKEQLAYRKVNVTELKYYHAVSKRDLASALEYNMDVRRYTDKYCCSSDKKNPTFYRTPAEAFEAHLASSEKAILICKVLSNYNGENKSKANDAEYMPIYVAEICS